MIESVIASRFMLLFASKGGKDALRSFGVTLMCLVKHTFLNLPMAFVLVFVESGLPRDNSFTQQHSE